MAAQLSRVWLITGCSSGLGQEIATAALAYGDRVVATARDPTKLQELQSRGATVVALDVLADDGELKKTVAKIVEKAGQIDVLVNNAGYILTGAVEECRSVSRLQWDSTRHRLLTYPTTIAGKKSSSSSRPMYSVS